MISSDLISKNYKCSNYERKTVYEFKDHFWTKFLDFNDFRELLSNYHKTTGNDSVLTDDLINKYLKSIYDPLFEEKLNSKPNLTCFTNGVFDCYTEIFRDGTPDDFIGYCICCDYKVTDENRKERHDAMLKICQEHVQWKLKMHELYGLSV